MCLYFCPTFVFGEEVKVVAITHDEQQIKVRLAEIDTPERKQPYGKKAKQALSKLVFGKRVDLRPVTTDRYGRTVGHLFIGLLNREQGNGQKGPCMGLQASHEG